MLKNFWSFQKSIKYLFVVLVLFSCKKTDLNNIPQVEEKVLSKTIKEIAFSGTFQVSKGTSQLSSDKTKQRVLIPIESNITTFYKYYLLENNITNKTQLKTYVITKKPINKGVDLFNISFNEDGVTAYDVADKDGISYKLMLKHNGKELDLNSTLAQSGATDKGFVTANADPGGDEVGYCIDHWWVMYDVETGMIVSIEYLGYDCYGCMQTNTCTGNGGGGGGATGVDSAALLAAVLDEYNGIHEGEFEMHTEKWIYVQQSATINSPLISPINNWPILDAEYYKVTAKTVAQSAVIPVAPPSTYWVVGKIIKVIECKTNSTLFEMKKTSLFWRVKWQQGNTPNGTIFDNLTPFPHADCDADGYIHIEARSSWWEFMNAMPTITSSSDLNIFFQPAPAAL